MREILFRGKKVQDGEWTYGYYIKDTINKKKGPIHLILNDDGDCEVLPETVGQLTGLYDKQDNKVFEGDLLSDGNENGVVIYYPTEAMFMVKFDDEDEPQEISQFGMWAYISGNIHDNPELL